MPEDQAHDYFLARVLPLIAADFDPNLICDPCIGSGVTMPAAARQLRRRYRNKLAYATFLGGHYGDFAVGIAVNLAGDAFLTGATQSSDFPTTSNAFDRGFDGGSCDGRPCWDAFAARLSPNGNALVYGTFVGGHGNDDFGLDIALDAAGHAFVSGWTTSKSFPTTPGAFDTTFSSRLSVGFVAKLNAAGSQLVYSTLLESTGLRTWGSFVAVDGQGNAYVTGFAGPGFPVTAGTFQPYFGGGSEDAFVTKLNPSGTELVYSTYLGGYGRDVGADIAVDSASNAFAVGFTSSYNFPTTDGAFSRIYRSSACGSDSHPCTDAFVVKLAADGSRLAYGTFLGGSTDETCQIHCTIAVDSAGATAVIGSTDSVDFPTTASAFDPGYNGSSDAFVAKLDPAGSTLAYATFRSVPWCRQRVNFALCEALFVEESRRRLAQAYGLLLELANTRRQWLSTQGQIE